MKSHNLKDKAEKIHKKLKNLETPKTKEIFKIPTKHTFNLSLEAIECLNNLCQKMKMDGKKVNKSDIVSKAISKYCKSYDQMSF